MNQQLSEETRRLEQAWLRHSEEMLRDYLVAGIHDPRLNPQSIRGRHFLIHALFDERFATLRDEEFRFATVMRWLLETAREFPNAEDWNVIAYGLERGADNVEGIPLPPHVVNAFGMLPKEADGVTVPNYLREVMVAAQGAEGAVKAVQQKLDLFATLWKQCLEKEQPAKISVLEAACGSANDYRALEQYGLSAHIGYVGFDLCEKNVLNARQMFPEARFEAGNVFSINHPDRTFDCCIAHDLLEHLSIEGLEQAVSELARVAQRGVFIGFFQMHEGAEHVVRVVGDYHINTLSLPLVRKLFAKHGMQTKAMHVVSWLKYQQNCSDEIYYDTAYDLICWREAESDATAAGVGVKA